MYPIFLHVVLKSATKKLLSGEYLLTTGTYSGCTFFELSIIYVWNVRFYLEKFKIFWSMYMYLLQESWWWNEWIWMGNNTFTLETTTYLLRFVLQWSWHETWFIQKYTYYIHISFSFIFLLGVAVYNDGFPVVILLATPIFLVYTVQHLMKV